MSAGGRRWVFQMRLTCAALTDPGRRRENNEDSVCVREDLGLFLVADGMGGHVGGEIASRLVVEAVERFVAETAPGRVRPSRPAGPGAGDRLNAALIEANRRLAARIARRRRAGRHGYDGGRRCLRTTRPSPSRTSVTAAPTAIARSISSA